MHYLANEGYVIRVRDSSVKARPCHEHPSCVFIQFKAIYIPERYANLAIREEHGIGVSFVLLSEDVETYPWIKYYMHYHIDVIPGVTIPMKMDEESADKEREEKAKLGEVTKPEPKHERLAEYDQPDTKFRKD